MLSSGDINYITMTVNEMSAYVYNDGAPNDLTDSEFSMQDVAQLKELYRIEQVMGDRLWWFFAWLVVYQQCYRLVSRTDDKNRAAINQIF